MNATSRQLGAGEWPIQSSIVERPTGKLREGNPRFYQ